MKYSYHARQRMRMRRISEAEVETVVKSPHTTYPDGNGNTCLVADVGTRRIKVVISGADPSFVITTMVVT
jgi:hypothetical protein